MGTEPSSIKSIFCAALEQKDARELGTYLDSACGSDAGLRAEVESLLKSHEEAVNFLPSPGLNPEVLTTRILSVPRTYSDQVWELFDRVTDLAPADQEAVLDRDCGSDPGLRRDVEELLRCRVEAPVALLQGRDAGNDWLHPGSRLDDYEIVRLIGTGGMGTVYEAQQFSPRRCVALKVIKPGQMSSEASGRFRHEGEILGQLQHPGIAQIFEAGTATLSDGTELPFIAMEYVCGMRLDEYVRHEGLGTYARLELVARVCDAVHHAHQRGVIHRDLKPENVLVTKDGTAGVGLDHRVGPVGQPKVLDFGIARVIGPEAERRTIETRADSLVGTLGYMSPEQVSGNTAQIDVRCDVWALGVMLFEVLAGHHPIDLEDCSVPEAVRRIKETDPARLTDFDSTLRGDVSVLVSRALAKDKERRYQTAADLAEDIRRYLRGEAIKARADSTLYVLRKTLRRHRALATGLASVFLVFLAGVAGIVAFAVKADRQARTAQAVTDFLGEDLLGSVALQQAMSREVTVRSIVQAAAARLEGEFGNRPLVEASIRQHLGRTYVELGDYRQAELHLERAYDLRRRQLGENDLLVLDSMSQLGRLHLLQGRYAEAEPLLARALDSRRRRLGPDQAETLQTSIWLGLVYRNLRQPDALQKAEALLTSAFESCTRLFGKEDPMTLEAMYGLAFLHFGGPGQESQALPLCFEGWEIAKKVLGEGHRLTFDFMVMGAWLQAWIGRFEEAERNAQIGIETGKRVLGEAHPQTIMALATLGEVYLMQHRFAEAEEPAAEAVRLASQTLGKSNEWTLQHKIRLGRIYMMEGKYLEAERQFTEVRADGRPNYTDSSPVMRNATQNIISLYTMQERGEALERWYLEELNRLTQSSDDNRSLRASILNAVAWYQATYPSVAIRDGAKAIENARKACELTDRNVPNYIDTLAAAYAETGDFHAAVREERVVVELTASRQDASRFDRFLEFHLRLFESGQVIRESLLSWRARTMLREAKYRATEQELTAALTAAQRFLGEAHAETRGCILGFIELYDVWNRPEEAAKWRVRLAAVNEMNDE
jgi:serine/threonine protein kinase